MEELVQASQGKAVEKVERQEVVCLPEALRFLYQNISKVIDVSETYADINPVIIEVNKIVDNTTRTILESAEPLMLLQDGVTDITKLENEVLKAQERLAGVKPTRSVAGLEIKNKKVLTTVDTVDRGLSKIKQLAGGIKNKFENWRQTTEVEETTTTTIETKEENIIASKDALGLLSKYEKGVRRNVKIYGKAIEYEERFLNDLGRTLGELQKGLVIIQKEIEQTEDSNERDRLERYLDSITGHAQTIFLAGEAVVDSIVAGLHSAMSAQEELASSLNIQTLLTAGSSIQGITKGVQDSIESVRGGGSEAILRFAKRTNKLVETQGSIDATSGVTSVELAEALGIIASNADNYRKKYEQVHLKHGDRLIEIEENFVRLRNRKPLLEAINDSRSVKKGLLQAN